ncbi:MAG: hypothetical protein PHW72_02835 [Candidatus Pacebacteria bacterium]|nr:hypothetical protein [Candidatus Paceibacterota bacterium]
MSNLSKETQTLISRYQNWYQANQKKGDVSTIHVDEVASRVASFYEKIRGIVDWKEEHLMRRAAISRSLKRRLFLIKESEKIAEPLILELIRGGHFPNDKIPASKIPEIQKALDKYIFILDKLSSLAPQSFIPQKINKNSSTGLQIHDWLLEIASCEIEEILSSPQKEQALIEYMMESIKNKIKVREGVFTIGGINEEEKNTQIYIAIHRALLKLDTPIISYDLLKRKYSDWRNLSRNDKLLQDIADNIYSVCEKISNDLRHPLAEKFYRICEKYDTPYLIIGDVVSRDPVSIQDKLQKADETERLVIEAYDKRLKTSRLRIRRAAIYATLSIFASKILLALALEIPIDRALTGQFSIPALATSILFPPLLMAFLVLTITSPPKENRQMVIMEVMKILYSEEKNGSYTIEVRRKRGWLMNAFISFFYLLASFLSFGAIFIGLYYLQFPPVSYVIFTIFVSLISFAGVKLRERSKELQITEPKGTFLGFLIDLFSLPVVSLGKWLSARFVKYNIIMVFFNSLIDMPFQLFIEFLEQWRSFLKEKKEEIH